MNNLKRLAMAAGAWLQYEFACHRSQLFDEGSLVTPLSTALQAIYNKKLHTEFLHPVLAPLKKGPGRRPEIDFAVIEDYPKISCAVESKWINANGIKIEDVVWDLLRLELIAYQEQADAYFVLGGRKKHLNAFFSSKAFLGSTGSHSRVRAILKMRSQPKISLSNPLPERKSMFYKLLTDYQDLLFPTELVTSIGEKFPESSPNFQYQAYVWQVHRRVRRFKPRDHSFYGKIQS